MKNIFNKRNIFILVALFLIIPLIIFLSSISKKDLSNARYEKILQAVIASPKAAEIKIEGEDITDEFIDEYRIAIENENYTEVIKFLRDNKISISMSINGENEFLIEKME